MSELRWVENGVIGGRPTASDAIAYAEERLADPEEAACVRTDQRMRGCMKVANVILAATFPPGDQCHRISPWPVTKSGA